MRASHQEKKAQEEKKRKEREELEQQTFKKFVQAIQSGDFDEMELILHECIIDCNYSDDTGTSPLTSTHQFRNCHNLRYDQPSAVRSTTVLNGEGNEIGKGL